MSDSLMASSTSSDSSLAWQLHWMTQRIRQSLELSDILTVATAEVQAFLGTDRVKIYQFHADGSGEVVAETIHDQRLPVLLGHSFPADDIPAEARTRFLQARVRSLINVAAQTIGISGLEPRAAAHLAEDIQFRPLDPCHAEYLLAMGVQSSLVVPLIHRNLADIETLWGLLVSHHSQPCAIGKAELHGVQLIADQIAVAIAQADLLRQARQTAAQEATIHHIAALLHTSPQMHLQAALEHTITVLSGTGGRLYLCAHSPHHPAMVIPVGDQPQPDLEQHPHWLPWLALAAAVDEEEKIWAIDDIEISTMPSELAMVLAAVPLRGLLIMRLHYRQQVLGYLSVFRPAVDVERIWAGRIDSEDPRQVRPRLSFETWREVRHHQAQPWTPDEIQLSHDLAHHFSVAIYQASLYEQVCHLNRELAKDIQQRKQTEVELASLNAALEQRVIERTAQLQQINAELQQQMVERDRAQGDRQQAETSLARLSHQNELILNSAGEGIYGLNPQGELTFANPAAAKILGYSVSALTGKWMHGLLNPAKSDGTPYLLTDSPIFKTLNEGTLQHRSDDRFHRQDGSSFPVEYVSSPMQDSEEPNQIVGAVVVFKDITARQAVEQLKDEFVSVVSHELRTPLTAIRSTLGLLSSGWLNSYPEKSQRMLEIAYSNTNRLVRLISDILDVERIKFGKVTMEKVACNAADLMTQSAETMRAMAEKNEIHLVVCPINVTLNVDPDRMIQTLTNLINNAIKFSPPHTTVQLSAALINAASMNAADQSHIQFRVSDQGCGIPEDKLDTIFDRFEQVDATNSRSQGGTGLGLTICRSIVQQHGGLIGVESTLGEGSTFYFTVPL